MEKTYECLKEIVEEQLKQIVKKGDAITAQEMSSAKDAMEIIEKIDEQTAKMGYSDGYHYGTKRSPVTGRYISSGVYGAHGYDHPRTNHMYGHSIKDRMIARLEPMYDETSSEHERQMIANTISRIQSEI